jgi:triosephosphate isomerase
MRSLFIAGNWKMNPNTAEAAAALAQAVKAGAGPASDVRVALCPPAVFLPAIDAVLAGSPIGLGAQNMHWKPEGAYTGELSGAMLNDVGCTHVILGHSERRHGMDETDAQVNASFTPRSPWGSSRSSASARPARNARRVRPRTWSPANCSARSPA